MEETIVPEQGGAAPDPHCSNCGAPLSGRFCAACGQPRDTHRRSVRKLTHELVQDIFSFDSRVMRTVQSLLLDPGELSRAFREGRMQRYVPAVRLYLFVSLLFFLLLSATGIALLQLQLQYVAVTYSSDAAGNVYGGQGDARKLLPGLKADTQGRVYTLAGGRRAVDPDKEIGHTTFMLYSTLHMFEPVGARDARLSKTALSEVAKARKQTAGAEDRSWFSRTLSAAARKLEADPSTLNEPFKAWVPRVLFLLLPLFALLLAAFFGGERRGFYYVDHLVFSLNFHSFAFAMLMVVVALSMVSSASWAAELAIVVGAYFLFGLKRFYRQGWVRTVAKFAAISVVYSFLLVIALGTAVFASIAAL